MSSLSGTTGLSASSVVPGSFPSLGISVGGSLFSGSICSVEPILASRGNGAGSE
jgi:hypothetical protein